MKQVSLFEGFPKTRVQYDGEGRIKGADIDVVAITPIRKLIADKLRWMIGIVAAVSAVATIYQMPLVSFWYWGLPFLVFIAGVIAGHFCLAVTLRAVERLRVSRESFQHRCWYGGWRRYDRLKEHRFILKEHPWTTGEARIIEFFKGRASNKGRTLWMRPYFSESFVLCFEYGRRAIPLMVIHGKTKSDLVLGRMNALDDALNGTLSGSSGMALKPEDEWGGTNSSLRSEF